LAPVFFNVAIGSLTIRVGLFLGSQTIVYIKTLETAGQNSKNTLPQDCLGLVKKKEFGLFLAVGEEGEKRSHAVNSRPPRRNLLE
jgi:hypothetical protein